MKLQNEIPPAEWAKLECAKTLLKKVIVRHAASVKRLANFRVIEKKCLAAIETLTAKASDGTDLKAATDLAGRQSQIVLLQNSIARTTQQTFGPDALRELRGAVFQAHQAIYLAVRHSGPALAEFIAAMLVPFCESPEQAMQIVRSQVPAVNYVIAHTATENFRGSMPDVASALAHAAKRLATIEALLAGGDFMPDYAPRPRAAKPAAPVGQLAAEQLGAVATR